MNFYEINQLVRQIEEADYEEEIKDLIFDYLDKNDYYALENLFEYLTKISRRLQNAQSSRQTNQNILVALKILKKILNK